MWLAGNMMQTSHYVSSMILHIVFALEK